MFRAVISTDEADPVKLLSRYTVDCGVNGNLFRARKKISQRERSLQDMIFYV